MNILKSQTFIAIGSVLEGRVEDADLAEEGGDQEGGAGGVGGGGQQVRHPRGRREHRGRDEVDVDVLTEQIHTERDDVSIIENILMNVKWRFLPAKTELKLTILQKDIALRNYAMQKVKFPTVFEICLLYF